MERDELAWERYKILAAEVSHRLDITIKAIGIFFAISGAVVSYCLTHIRDTPLAVWGLWLPVVLGLGFTAVSVWGVCRTAVIRDAGKEIAEALELGSRLDGRDLKFVLFVAAVAFGLTSAGCALLFFKLHCS